MLILQLLSGVVSPSFRKVILFRYMHNKYLFFVLFIWFYTAMGNLTQCKTNTAVCFLICCIIIWCTSMISVAMLAAVAKPYKLVTALSNRVILSLINGFVTMWVHILSSSSRCAGHACWLTIGQSMPAIVRTSVSAFCRVYVSRARKSTAAECMLQFIAMQPVDTMPCAVSFFL